MHGGRDVGVNFSAHRQSVLPQVPVVSVGPSRHPWHLSLTKPCLSPIFVSLSAGSSSSMTKSGSKASCPSRTFSASCSSNGVGATAVPLYSHGNYLCQ